MSKPDERALAAVTASLLRRGRMLHHVSLLLLVVALALFALKAQTCPLSFIAVLLLGAGEFWFALRVALDADLFDGLAGEKMDTAGMDKALAKLGLIREGKSARSMEDRARGGIRLLKLQGLCLLGQILGLVACVVTR